MTPAPAARRGLLRARGPGVGVGVCLLVLAMPGAAAAAEPGAPGLGPSGLSVTVDALERRDDGTLLVTATVANRGEEPALSLSLRQFTDPDGTLGLAVVDPGTGAIGRADGEGGLLPLFVDPGQAVSVAVPVQDPGGSVVDVVFTSFHPVTGLAVDGPGDLGEVATLEARSTTPLPRIQQGAAEVVGTDQVTLDTSVLFAFDSADLSPEAGGSLDAAAEALTAQDGRSLRVSGHTDSQGEEAYNLDLSRRRAEAVRAALEQRLGPGWTFEVEGLGETQPVAPEVDGSGGPYPDGQARNRRVEVTVQG